MDRVTLVGVGRLGLCTALCFEQAGYDVLGVDLSPEYVESLNNKTFQSREPFVSEYLQKSTNFRATTSLDVGLAHSDVVWVLVDTPTGVDQAYDHSKLNRVLSLINDRKVVNKHLVICCTVLPGYVLNTGRNLVKDCPGSTLSYSPEFIAQGAIIAGLLHPDMVLIGEGSPEAGDILETMYRRSVKNNPKICRMSPESAEITKLAINCFITTKISYANMIGDIAAATEGADKYDILNAVGADTRIGSRCLMPGYGFGGPCFPRDNRALGVYATSVGIKPLISTASDEYNKFHTMHQVQEFLKENRSEFLFEDVCYKENCPVPIIEESQKLVVAKELALAGRKVTIKDRQFVIDIVKQQYGDIFSYTAVDCHSHANGHA